MSGIIARLNKLENQFYVSSNKVEILRQIYLLVEDTSNDEKLEWPKKLEALQQGNNILKRLVR